MNYWLIILFVLVISMIVGPIMMFKPSQRDQKLAALRQAAAQKGIAVRLAPKSHHSHQQAVAIYSLSFVRPESQNTAEDNADAVFPEWLLLKQSFYHEVHFDGYWDWQDKKNIAPSTDHQTIKSLLELLDQEFVGVELSKNSIGVWWTEKSHSIEDIHRLLNQLKSQLIA